MTVLIATNRQDAIVDDSGKASIRFADLIEDLVDQVCENTVNIESGGGGGGGVSDHDLLTNNGGAGSHATITAHIADGTIHFTEASIDHLNIMNIGVNSHAAIDTHIADTANPHSVTLQQAYAAATTVPQVTINGTPDPLTIDASVAGDIFALRDSSDVDRFRVSDTEISFGRSGRRHQRMDIPDGTGRIGTELWPDDFTISTATGFGSAFSTDASRVITLDIPGGAPFFSNTAPGGFNFAHTVRFEEPGFIFASQLLINAAVRVECAANVGPLYLFLDQYRTFADGAAFTCTQHNTIRAQPSWGPNINGGSITQNDATLLFLATTVDATVGSASVTNWRGIGIFSPILVAGGTIGTWTGIDILNISGPTTIRGINSAMNNGLFINHTGTANSVMLGSILFEADSVGVTFGASQDVQLGWAGAANEFFMQFNALSDQLRIGNPSAGRFLFDSNIADNEFNFNCNRFSLGAQTGAVGNGVGVFVAGTRTVSIGGEWSDFLLTQAGDITVDAAMGLIAGWTVNAPSIVLGTGSVTDAGVLNVGGNVTEGSVNRFGMRILSNPSGGSGVNAALWVTAGLSRFDGRVDINNGIALGGGAAATLGTIGGSGPTAAAQAQWVEIDIGGVAHWMPAWT